MMNAHDKAISDLMDALDAILRANNIHFAHGCAEQAMKRIRAQQTRNADGYFVLAVAPAVAEDK